jgi:hypothetical protein
VVVTISGVQWLNFAINAVLPAIVALVVARVANPAWKALVLLFLSAVSGFLLSWLGDISAGTPFAWDQAAFTVLTGFAVAVLSHFGLLQPISLTGKEGVIQQTLGGGLGGGEAVQHQQLSPDPVVTGEANTPAGPDYPHGRHEHP